MDVDFRTISALGSSSLDRQWLPGPPVQLCHVFGLKVACIIREILRDVADSHDLSVGLVELRVLELLSNADA